LFANKKVCDFSFMDIKQFRVAKEITEFRVNNFYKNNKNA